MTTVAALEGVDKLRRDLREAAGGLGHREARFLVDAYYTLQHHRIEAANQVRALTQSDEPNDVLQWLFDQHATLENEIKKALGPYTDAHAAGRWSKSITGIGPVLSAGLLAHIDIERSQTAGQIWRFAGLDPTLRWLGNAGAVKLLGHVDGSAPIEAYDEMDVGDTSALTDVELEALATLDDGARGQLSREQLVMVSRLTNRKLGNLLRLGADDKGRVTRASLLKLLAKRPWNANLKVLCWKIGESFVKVAARDSDVYGKVYLDRKMLEEQRNDDGMFADQAERTLAEKTYSKSTEAYKAYSEGRLPQGRIHARAKRYAVKLFLSHWHHVAYESHFGTPPPKPYIIEHGGHTHFLAPPNWPMA